MRIALNTRILQAPRTGIGQYVAALAQALGEQPGVDLDYFHGWGWSQALPRAALPGYSRWSSAARRVPGAYRIRRWLEQQRFDRGLRERDVQLYHEPSLWPLAFEGPMVMTVHDLTHVRYPQTQPRDRLAEIERHVGEGVARAGRILVDSHFVGEELRAYFGLPAERVMVAPLGCAPRFRPRTAEQLRTVLAPLALEAGGYLICVGTLEPRKNLQQALRAHALLPPALRERYPLLIAGMAGWRQEQLDAELAVALAGGQVRLLGYLDDDVLACVLAGARLLLFPSLYEGFGLPVLEAMASGVPTVLARTSSLPEVAGEAGCFVEPQDEQGMADAIQRLLEDGSEWTRLRSLGLDRAGAFSWQACARATVEAYRQAMGG